MLSWFHHLVDPWFVPIGGCAFGAVGGFGPRVVGFGAIGFTFDSMGFPFPAATEAPEAPHGDED